VINKVLSYLKKSDFNQILFGLFVLASFFPFRHVLNFSSASRFGWYAEPLAISVYVADIIFIFLLFTNWKKWCVPGIDKTIIYIVAFIFFLAEAFRNSDLALGTYSLIRLVQFLILIYLSTRLLTKEKLRTFIAIILLAIGILQSLLGIYQVSTGHSLGLRYLGEQTISVSANGVAKVDLGNGEYMFIGLAAQ